MNRRRGYFCRVKPLADGSFGACRCGRPRESDIKRCAVCRGPKLPKPPKLPRFRAGDQFGQLTLISPIKRRDSKGGVFWRCECSCRRKTRRVPHILSWMVSRGVTPRCARSCPLAKERNYYPNGRQAEAAE
jgi:hypothetical protein